MSTVVGSKFNIIHGSPPALPGKCVSCGRVEGIFIDWGMDIEYYGAVYLCADEFQQVANELGYHSPTQWKALIAEKNEQYAELNEALDRNEVLENAVRSLTSLGITASSASDTPIPDDKDNESVTKQQSVTSNSVQGSTEQVTEPRSTDLRGDVSLDDFGIGGTI